MEKDFFKKINFSFIGKKKNTFKKKRFSPHHVWKRVKLAFAMSFILVIGFGIFMFIAVDRNLLSRGGDDSEILTAELNKNSINKLIEILDQKKANFEFFSVNESGVVDPYQN
jgi:hypothetical protein